MYFVKTSRSSTAVIKHGGVHGCCCSGGSRSQLWSEEPLWSGSFPSRRPDTLISSPSLLSRVSQLYRSHGTLNTVKPKPIFSSSSYYYSCSSRLIACCLCLYAWNLISVTRNNYNRYCVATITCEVWPLYSKPYFLSLNRESLWRHISLHNLLIQKIYKIPMYSSLK